MVWGKLIRLHQCPKGEPVRSLLTFMLLAAAVLPALGQAQTGGVSVPLMLVPDSERQGFVRIINGTGSNGSVRITAVDDAGNAAQGLTGGQGDSFANPFNLAVGGQVSGSIDPADESNYYRIRVSESGTLSVYTSGDLDTFGDFYDSRRSWEGQLIAVPDNDDGAGLNFRIEHEVDAGTYYVRVRAYSPVSAAGTPNATGSYTVHAELDAEPPTGGFYYGALALGRTGARGISTDEATQAVADSTAIAICVRDSQASHTCTIPDRLVRFGPGYCIVLYKGTSPSQRRSYYWRTAPRGRLSELKSEALRVCNIEYGGDRDACLHVATECNSGSASGIAPPNVRRQHDDSGSTLTGQGEGLGRPA